MVSNKSNATNSTSQIFFKKIIWFLLFLVFSFQKIFAGPYVTPVPGSACYDPTFGNVYQKIVSGTTYDYDFNYSGAYTQLSCSNKTALGAVGSCTLRSMGIDYPRGRLFTIIQYSPCPVPIDDYAWILFAITCCLGYTYLRKDKIHLQFQK